MMSRTLVFARIVTLIWAGFWTYFTVASGLLTAPPNVQFRILPLIGLAWVALRFAWRTPVVVGCLLLAEGLSLLAMFFIVLSRGTVNDLFLIGTLILPPLVTGALFLVGGIGKMAEAECPPMPYLP